MTGRHGGGVVARLVRWLGWQAGGRWQCRRAVARLLAVADGAGPGGWAGVVERAYAVAACWHRGQWRLSGAPYLTHPVAVALIVAEAGADPPVLCAALLHDVPEVTGCTLGELQREFGAEIAGLVGQVRLLDEVSPAALAAAAGGVPPGWDERALLVKLADRLHNMRTLRHHAPGRQQLTSGEVIAGFVPLARALGQPAIERELADRAAAVLAASGSHPGRPWRGLSGCLLAASALLLPGPARGRWLQEWAGELATLPTRLGRARFAASMLAGMPAMAGTLRRPLPGRDANLPDAR